MLRDIGYVLGKLDWMRAERIWPNGLRYLWTDAFGVVLYISLYRELSAKVAGWTKSNGWWRWKSKTLGGHGRADLQQPS